MEDVAFAADERAAAADAPFDYFGDQRRRQHGEKQKLQARAETEQGADGGLHRENPGKPRRFAVPRHERAARQAVRQRGQPDPDRPARARDPHLRVVGAADADLDPTALRAVSQFLGCQVAVPLVM